MKPVAASARSRRRRHRLRSGSGSSAGGRGTEAWRALPGEGHLSFTGEPGGLWRSRARAPQKLTGIGFVAQGYEAAAGYRRNADLDPRAAWVLEGVAEGGRPSDLMPCEAAPKPPRSGHG